MHNQNHLKRRTTFLFICLATISIVIFFTSFVLYPEKKSATSQTETNTFSGHIPLYKMNSETVNDIISGLPLDRRLIFQFVIDGSPTSEVDVIWYEASGMLSHGEGKASHDLEKITGTAGISFGTAEKYVLANNYLFVKDFKTYIRTLPSEKYLYIEFRPIKDVVNNHVYFKIKAVYNAQVLKDSGYSVEAGRENESVYADEGIDSQPSPPANTQQGN